MRVLVTGAGGFVGGYLVRYLQDAGHEVVASSLTGPPAGTDGWWEVLDLTDGPAVRDRLARVRPQGIIHCAAQASVGGSWADPQATYRSNIEGTGNLLEAVRECKPRIVLVGSAQQYARPKVAVPLRETDPQEAGSPYALTKIAQEQMGLMYLRHYGLESIFTRSFNHTGPGQSPEYAVGSFCSQIARLIRDGGSEMHVGSLDSRRDFLDVRDVVRAYAMLLERGEAGEAYNICSGNSVRLGDVLDKLLQVSGLKGRVTVHQRTLHVSAGTDELVGDPTKVQTALGWAPEVSLDRSLTQTLDRYRTDLEALR